MNDLKRTDIIHPELSYKLVGVLFDVHKEMGYGFLERYYQKAVAAELKRNRINFKEQVKVELVIAGEIITSGTPDFIIEDKIILEIKQGNTFLKTNIDQLNSYLKMTKLQLGILANFTSRGLLYKRILNT
ncbi:MAG: GxxExxY protein [Bacteroidetes bacterium]|nr:GxxExxY protein [Bacteroidota bacterium]